MENVDTPYIYSRVRMTWLSRRPHPGSKTMAAGALLFLLLTCAAHWSNLFGMAELWPATRAAVFAHGEVWRLWTSLFVHADLGHLVANSLLFFILAFFLYGYFGAIVFPLAACFMGGVTNAIVIATYPPHVSLIGASGVVSWMGGAWLALYFLLNTKISRVQRAMRSFGVALMLFAPSEAFDPSISYRTHLIGFVLGVFSGAIYYWWYRVEFKNAEVLETIVD